MEIKKETFLKKIKFINYLDAKISYGQKYKISSLVKTVYINAWEELSSEKIKEIDFTVEFGLFSNRLNGRIAFFSSKSEDLLDLLTTSGVGGMTVKYRKYW